MKWSWLNFFRKRSDPTEPECIKENTGPLIFISYAHKDESAVTQLVKFLEISLRAKGIGYGEVFYDRVSLLPGQKWEPEIYKAIANCLQFYCFWSENALWSEHVSGEVRYARDCKKPIIPVLMDDTPLFFGLEEYQFIKLSIGPMSHPDPVPLQDPYGVDFWLSFPDDAVARRLGFLPAAIDEMANTIAHAIAARKIQKPLP